MMFDSGETVSPGTTCFSGTTRKTSGSGTPVNSDCRSPVMLSASGFMKVMKPLASMTIIAMSTWSTMAVSRRSLPVSIVFPS